MKRFAGFTPLENQSPTIYRKGRSFLTGFTLIETIISVAILVVLAAGTFAVLTTGEKTYKQDIELLKLQQAVRIAMDAMVKEIRGARSITPVSASEIRFDSMTVLGFRYFLDAADENSDTFTNQILRGDPLEPNPGDWRVLANNINALTFDYSNPPFLRIEIDAATTVWAGGEQERGLSYSLQEMVRIRNE